jgi:hypothetical protein
MAHVYIEPFFKFSREVRVMRIAKAVCFLLVLAVLLTCCAVGMAGDMYYVGKIGTPGHTDDLRGLESIGDVLFAVSDLYMAGSCMYLIDSQTGAVLRDTCFNDTIISCESMELDFLACAYKPLEQLDYGEFIVADACGAILRYAWSDTLGPVRLDSFEPDCVWRPTGLIYRNEAYFILDEYAYPNPKIFKVDYYTEACLDSIALPMNIYCPRALTAHNNHFWVTDCENDSLWEIDASGMIVDQYHLDHNTTSSVMGLTWIGDSLYVASSDTTINIYTFATSYAESLPEGSNVVVEPVPEALEVAFDSVSTAGSLYVRVTPTQPCPPPGGVMFFSDYFDVSTDATFEYITQVTLMTDYELPGGVNPEKVRVFVRPSGPCMPWRDITVAPLEIVPPFTEDPFRVMTRTQSEDDEFSVFVLGEDNRNPAVVAGIKFGYLEDAIVDNEEYLTEEDFIKLTDLLDEAAGAFGAKRIARALRLVNRIAEYTESRPGIPHRYDPEGSVPNVAGQIISRAHTLAFTLGLLVEAAQSGEGGPMLGRDPAANPAIELTPRFEVAPNASGAGVTITLSGTAKEPVSLSIYSVEGQLVSTLVRAEVLNGSRSVTWNGTDNHGVKVATGIYFAVLRHGDATDAKKLILWR